MTEIKKFGNSWVNIDQVKVITGGLNKDLTAWLKLEMGGGVEPIILTFASQKDAEEQVQKFFGKRIKI